MPAYPDTQSYLDTLSKSYTTPPSSGMTGGTAPSTSTAGAVPNLATGSPITNQTLAGLNQAIPNFSALSGQASSNIGNLLAGRLPTDVNNYIQNSRAQQAVQAGMPGTSRWAGTSQGNATLRDLGLTSLQAQQTGLSNLLDTLGSYAGNVTPTAGQNLSAQQAAADRAQQESQFGRTLANQASQFQQTSAQNQQQLDNQAKQFEQNFGLQERQVAQQYGLSLGELALAMAQLQFSQDSYANDYALKLAELQNNYNLASGGVGSNYPG